MEGRPFCSSEAGSVELPGKLGVGERQSAIKSISVRPLPG